MEQKLIYYELSNSINEYHSSVVYRNIDLEKVKEEMKNHSDWWRDNGTGTIYKVTYCVKENGEIHTCRREVFRK